MKNSQSHVQILAKFLQHYPEYMDDATSWAPAGSDSIYITLADGAKKVFTYTDDGWTLIPARRMWKRKLLGRLSK